MSTLTQTLFAGNTLAERFATFRAELADKMAKRKVYRKTYAELSNLSARELADLGISPANIGQIAYEAAYGK